MTTLISGGTVIDGTGTPPKPDTNVLIEGDSIVAVGPASELPMVGDDATVIDASGAFVIPGLIDAHVHMSALGDHDIDPTEVPPTSRSAALSAAYGLQNARAMLAAGVTAVRDVGTYGDVAFLVRDLIEAGRVPGPRVMACGAAVAIPSGHGAGVISVEASGIDDVRKAVKAQLERGADVIKFMASGSGVSEGEDPYDVEFSEEELRAGFELAREAGLTVAVHSTNPTATKNAVRAGANTIEHGVLMDEEAFELMREHDVSFVPTLWIYRFFTEYGPEVGLITQERADEARGLLEGHSANVRRAHELGIPIVAGADDGSLGLVNPFAIHHELEWLVASGLSPLEALQAATGNAARAMRREELIGSIAPGRAADLVVLSADPLEDIRNTARIARVIKAGRTVDDSVREAAVMAPAQPIPSGPSPQPAAAGTP